MDFNNRFIKIGYFAWNIDYIKNIWCNDSYCECDFVRYKRKYDRHGGYYDVDTKMNFHKSDNPINYEKLKSIYDQIQ